MNGSRTDGGVLFVSGTLEVGGSEAKVVKIANALAQSGYRTSIAYLNPPDTLLENIDSGVSVVHLQRSGKYSTKSLRALRRLIKNKYGAVVSVNFYPLLYVLPAVKLFPSHKCAAIGLVNTTDFVDGQWIYGPIYSPFLRRCDYLVFGCEAQQRVWTERYRLLPSRTRYIYNGVDSEFYSPKFGKKMGAEFRRANNIPPDAFLVGSIGRLAPEKHFSLLIEAVSRLIETGRSAYLVVVGEGGELEQLQHTARSHGVADKIVFPGAVRDVRPALQAMNQFVLPSRAVETFSNAALEAMAMSCPVILSDIGGAAEMVEHMKSGVLFKVGSVNELVENLVLLYDSEQLRDKLGRAARERVVERFHFDTMVESYRVLIDSANAG